MDTPTTITAAVVAFFALLVVLTFIRLLLRKTPPTWRSIRLGFFVERVPDEDNPLPPTTYQRPIRKEEG